MTPQELFENLCMLYPKKYEASSRVAWAMEYGRILGGIDGEVLRCAYDSAKKATKYAPTPNEILAHIPTPPPKVSENKYEDPFPHESKAENLFRTDSECKQAVAEGWGLGLFEFIAKHGYTPSMSQRQHIIDTNQLFHDQYKACLDGERVPASRYSDKVQESCRKLGIDGILIDAGKIGMFEAQIKKRNDNAAKYGCN